MCGIFCLLNNKYTYQNKFIEEQFMKGKSRGPEFSILQDICLKCGFGFHRLAINGLNNESNQPIIIKNIALICNGEIYNYKELYELLDVQPTTNSDCEIIIHLYEKFGIEQTLQMIDGVFAFVLCDFDIQGINTKLYVARDPYGVRPLYMLAPKKVYYGYDDLPLEKQSEHIIAFASELKVLNEIYNPKLVRTHKIEHFKPGTYSYYIMPFKVLSEWIPKIQNIKYHSFGFNSIMYGMPYNSNENSEYISRILENIRYYFINAIKKRVLVTERPVACLLSGGLDSSLVTALVNEIRKQYTDKPLETYSIGLKGSEDLKYAKIVSDYLGTKHTSIELTEEQFFKAIPKVIQTIESYDTTTVRASIGNYLVSEYIANHSDAKVIFNGDGADELCGGYLYMHHAPNAIEFDSETRRLLNDIHMYDVLRSDKCISSNGLEPRTPFLDRSFVQYYLSLHPSLRYHKGQNQCEKYLIRKAFDKEFFLTQNGKSLLPDQILWRTKEAFSDGVSGTTRSLYQIIQEHVTVKLQFENDKIISKIENVSHNTPDTEEKKYYRIIFEKYYPNMSNVVPYFWMPKYVEAKDASARTLQIYKEISDKNNNKINSNNNETMNLCI